MTPKELKNSILQLAMEGKLVKQRKEEGSAETLYAEIQKEKQKLVDNKLILKKAETKPYFNDSEYPFNIPKSWKWVQLSDVSLIQEGAGIRKFQYRKNGTQLLCVTNILEGKVDLKNKQIFIDEKEYKKKYLHLTLKKGDIVTSCSGGSWGKVAIFKSNETLMLNTSTLRLRFFNDLSNNMYLYYISKSDFFKNQLKNQLSGMQPNFGYAHYSRICFPLPPLDEQQRIIEKIEELMPLVDRYEVLYNRLNELNKEFPKKLKNAVLQKAIEGKLVKQIKSEGDAEDLYKEIQKEKQKLIKQGKLKKEKELPEITDDEVPFEIPKSWKMLKLSEVVCLDKGRTEKSGKYNYLEVKYLRGKSEPKKIDKGIFVSKGKKVILVDGENSGEIFDITEDGYLGSTFNILNYSKNIDIKYLLNYLEFYREILRNNKKGAAIPHLNKNLFFNLNFPLPPIAEQKRIVEKIEEILPNIEKLEKYN